MKMSLIVVLAAATITPTSAALLVHRNFLGQGMQPDVVARTLSKVEDEWKAQAVVFAECNDTEGFASVVNCADAPGSFAKSCGTVVNAIVQGSGGDREDVKEYMADVCGQALLSGWHQQHCSSLAVAVNKAMSADKYVNRMGFDGSKVCKGYWSQFVADEQARVAQEKVEREAAEKKAAEEAAEKERVRQEEEKKEAERRRAEEAARAKEEAQAKAAEARAKAAEAAEKAAQKKAEAEEVAKLAQQKMEEAEKAVQEHKKALDKANATTAEDTNTTEAAAPVQIEESAPVANTTSSDAENEANSTQPAPVANATEH